MPSTPPGTWDLASSRLLQAGVEKFSREYGNIVGNSWIEGNSDVTHSQLLEPVNSSLLKVDDVWVELRREMASSNLLDFDRLRHLSIKQTYTKTHSYAQYVLSVSQFPYGGRII